MKPAAQKNANGGFLKARKEIGNWFFLGGRRRFVHVLATTSRKTWINPRVRIVHLNLVNRENVSG